MNNKLIMQSLPLVAAVLGNKYGVKVNIGGSEAFTDGNTIHLPGLTLDSNETLTGLARGYIDHESAHIRETDFDAVKKAKLTPLEMNIWNNLEDWRVEEKLAGVFPGCRRNFQWLIRHIFGATQIDPQSPVKNLIPDWILLTVRSWHLSEIVVFRDKAEGIVESRYPGLSNKVKPVLQEIQSKCHTTSDSIFYAKKIVNLLKNIAKNNSSSQPPPHREKASGKKGKTATPGHVYRGDEKGVFSPKNAQKELEKLINAGPDELPKNMGEILSDHLNKITSSNSQDKVHVAVIGHRYFKPLTSAGSPELTRSTTALKTRLQSLLQSVLLKRSQISRKGRLDNRQLYKIAVSDPRMFIKPEEKQGLNTAVHILIDCSGSMRNRMKLTTQTCCALAKALGSVKGVNVGVTAFPADEPRINGSINYEIPAVCPVVKHGERIHSKFHTRASGCTPMGEAIWWILQQMFPLTEYRKIILVLSDGSPGNLPNTVEAINQGKKLGFEFYGIGIDTGSIKRILPKSSCRVNNLSELAPAMFGIMKTVFNNHK